MSLERVLCPFLERVQSALFLHRTPPIYPLIFKKPETVQEKTFKTVSFRNYHAKTHRFFLKLRRMVFICGFNEILKCLMKGSSRVGTKKLKKFYNTTFKTLRNLSLFKGLITQIFKFFISPLFFNI